MILKLSKNYVNNEKLLKNVHETMYIYEKN